jgi:insertion element IS1 protein InsB
VGSRGRKPLKKLWARIKHLKPFAIATDEWKVYRSIIPRNLLVQTKKLTQTVESVNSQVRDYLARFNRKTKRYSKQPRILRASLGLLWNAKLS